jgi:methyl-accepting chemotaxis protein
MSELSLLSEKIVNIYLACTHAMAEGSTTCTKQKIANSTRHTADSTQQTADSRQQRADSTRHTADTTQQTANSRQQTADKYGP